MSGPVHIVLMAGAMKGADTAGHNDYRAGCHLTAFLLGKTPDVRVSIVDNGWPQDDALFESARAIVFYTGGLTEHALQAGPWVDQLQQSIDRGVGLAMIHQAVRYPHTLAALTSTWIGGVHLPTKSRRSLWETQHSEFPPHEVTRGVQPWRITDGWLNHIQSVDRTRGVTPLLWSSREHGDASAGSAADVVSWTYERPNGGRSFCFTGPEAHSAWSVTDVRQLVVNGILWSAGVEVPAEGAPCTADEPTLKSFLTPHTPERGSILRGLRSILRRVGTAA